MAEYFCLTEDMSVLDVGGDMDNWNFLADRPRLTIINIDKRPENWPEYIPYVQADVRYLPFDSNAFDLVYSNSVIEHVGTLEDQMKMAEEVRRVGRSYYVQTPNFWFPVEPHLITPFLHWLPKPLRKVLIRNFTIWGWITRPTQDYCDNFVNMTRLLTKSEMRALFPDGQMQPEKFLGLNKSLIAVSCEGQQAR
jgi:2-polyprenyl-3-methyl-5-hydroxy-6-metoxy-1,4-benzoquinol methylase